MGKRETEGKGALYPVSEGSQLAKKNGSLSDRQDKPAHGFK